MSHVIGNEKEQTRVFNNLNALGVTQYGQMTAGSAMYIGSQGIVHGTVLTLAGAAAKQDPENPSLKGKVVVTSGLGGMSGAQPKAGNILGAIIIIAEVNKAVLQRRLGQGWVNEFCQTTEEVIKRVKQARETQESVSIAFNGNIVDIWEALATQDDIKVSVGSDQTSCHNPYNGGYYPVGHTVEESRDCMNENPDLFKRWVAESLERQLTAIERCMNKDNMVFVDYGNSLNNMAERIGHSFVPESYFKSIMGPHYFDYGFGPFRWVCMSQDPEDLKRTDMIAENVLNHELANAPEDLIPQLTANLNWIQNADSTHLVVGSQARILYSDLIGRTKIALQLNKAIRDGQINGPIVIGRDHHDVSGTDSCFRETNDISDGSSKTADMATHNFLANATAGADFSALHNGGGTGLGTSINGGFGIILDGSLEVDEKVKAMIFTTV